MPLFAAAGLCPFGEVARVDDNYTNLDKCTVEGTDIGIYCDLQTELGDFGFRYGDFVQLFSNGQVFSIPEMTTFNLSVGHNFNMIGDIDSRIRFGMDNVQDERAPLADDSFCYFADQHRDLGRYYYVDLRFRLL
ncbi:MAG: TonB-dependent receptor [Proteobacteria bacterium]|nr:TonB-dependent receptor [Pseudomonadota bacterium]MDA0896154.1 TonB-dependent receptor [Pseudomonadota bacterium]MDA1244738.1 TonB-dependent receptor [Pseudomonadota bacterium]